MKPELQPRDLLDQENVSFRFYGLLPSDRPRLSSDWPKIDLAAVGQKLEGIESIDEQAIDALTLGLLALDGERDLPDNDWNEIATRLSVLYARELKPAGSRVRRMKAARANFFLRDLLSAGEADAVSVTERSFGRSFVWDWMPLTSGELIVDSDERNVKYVAADGATRGWRLGLPTQADRLDQEHIALTSCYSPGWFAWSGPEKNVFHHHAKPVVLAFPLDGEIHYLDGSGAVYRPESEKAVVHAPVSAVWKARIVDDVIYISDWSEPGVLTTIDVRDWRTDRIRTDPVIITNDICRVGDRFYVIDKMQGQVFSFDSSFKPVGARLRFGKGAACLCDPIVIRPHGGRLNVVSWLTGKLTSMDPF